MLPLRVNTVADPELLTVGSSWGAPTRATVPLSDNATDLPKASLAAPSDWVRVACSNQVLPLRVNTVAEPCWNAPPTVSVIAPTMSVLPSADNATDSPNVSPCSPSDAVRVACSDQVLPLRVNTVTEPESRSPPLMAPRTVVLPSSDIAADQPK